MTHVKDSIESAEKQKISKLIRLWRELGPGELKKKLIIFYLNSFIEPLSFILGPWREEDLETVEPDE